MDRCSQPFTSQDKSIEHLARFKTLTNIKKAFKIFYFLLTG
jgi:hypothetical protein